MPPFFGPPRPARNEDSNTNDGAVDRLAADVRLFVDERPEPDLIAGVQRAIVDASNNSRPAQAIAQSVATLARMAWRPRPLQVRPIYALAAAAAVIVAALIPTAPVLPVPAGSRLAVLSAALDPPQLHVSPQPAPTRATPPLARTQARASSNRVLVQFRLPLAEAHAVQLAGSFTDWQQRYELRETSPGVWTATIALEPGVHDYLFVVDGHSWVPDPYAPRVSDGFGGVNSRLALMGPEVGAL